MKKIIATLLLLQAFSATSQLGVTTIKSNDFTPIDQWFSLRGRRQENKVYYQNEDSIADTVLEAIR